MGVNKLSMLSLLLDQNHKNRVDPVLGLPSPIMEKKPTETTPLAGPAEENEYKKTMITLASCLAFMACSASMMLVNKQVVRTFHTPVLILDIQLVFAAVVLPTFFFWTLRFGSKKDVMRWLQVVPVLSAGQRDDLRLVPRANIPLVQRTDLHLLALRPFKRRVLVLWQGR